MLPPTHYHPAQENLQSKEFRAAIERAKYARQNPNSPEGRAYQAGAEQRIRGAAEISKSVQPLLDEIAAAMILTAEDLATRVGPEPFE